MDCRNGLYISSNNDISADDVIVNDAAVIQQDSADLQ